MLKNITEHDAATEHYRIFVGERSAPFPLRFHLPWVSESKLFVRLSQTTMTMTMTTRMVTRQAKIIKNYHRRCPNTFFNVYTVYTD